MSGRGGARDRQPDGGRSTARRRGPSSVTGCAKNDLLGGGAVGSAGGRIVIPWDSGATNGGAERARESVRAATAGRPAARSPLAARRSAKRPSAVRIASATASAREPSEPLPTAASVSAARPSACQLARSAACTRAKGSGRAKAGSSVASVPTETTALESRPLARASSLTPTTAVRLFAAAAISFGGRKRHVASGTGPVTGARARRAGSNTTAVQPAPS